MQIIGLAYGTEKELDDHRKKLRKFMKEHCRGGQIRRYEFWDINFRKEFKDVIMHELARPHPTIRKTVTKLLSTPIIGKALINFIAKKRENDKDGYFEVVHDARPDVHNKSPDFNMLLLRHDCICDDGSENL